MEYPEGSNPDASVHSFEDRSDAGTDLGDYTPTSGDLVRQWHDLNGYYLEAKAAHEKGEIGSTVPAGLQKQLMSVQEQIRKAQEQEGKLYTQADIGSVLSTFAKTVYGVIREHTGEVEAAVIAGIIEDKITKEAI